MRPPPLIYNLFPTLVGAPRDWLPHADRARAMGFDWLYLNPVHFPGFSGSLYAVKDHYRLHPVLEGPDGRGLEALAPTLAALRQRGLSVLMDLVVNHTSRDSLLVAEHPGWFVRNAAGEVVSPRAVDPDDTTKETVWGDLAEIDHDTAEDREGLWRFWEQLVLASLDVGFAGFRCDAAYKVPAALWARLIARARATTPGVLFLAETLGCTVEETAALASAGFDYFYNSSKWWDFEAPWALEQHEQFRRVAPSIAFPESHDTPRLAAETGGNEAVQRQRYAFAAVFSAGVQIPVGYEFGFRRPLDVVRTRPADWESPSFDLTGFLARVNALKRAHPLLAGEGVLRRCEPETGEVTVLARWSDDAGTVRGLVLVNRDPAAPRTVALESVPVPAGARLFRPCRDDVPAGGIDLADPVALAPAEVALVMPSPSSSPGDEP
jgi:starch synthase (maltosyl-transferring)